MVGYYSDVSSPGKGSVKSGTIQIPIKVSKAAAASSAAATGPKTAISYKGGTVQIPNNKSAGIQALMQKPAASALKKSAARRAEGAEPIGLRGSCGACQQDVMDSQERVFSEASNAHLHFLRCSNFSSACLLGSSWLLWSRLGPHS